MTRMLTSALMLDNDTLNIHPTKRFRQPMISSRLCDTRCNQNPIHGISKRAQGYYFERYFKHVSPMFPALVLSDLESTSQNANSGQEVDARKLCHLHLALAIGAIFLSSDSIMDSSAACQLWAANFDDGLFHDESEDTIRILILLTLFSLIEDGCGNSWHLELLIRSCVKLGLHSRPIDQSPSADFAMLFWSGCLDLWISYTLGLLVSI